MARRTTPLAAMLALLAVAGCQSDDERPACQGTASVHDLTGTSVDKASDPTCRSDSDCGSPMWLYCYTGGVHCGVNCGDSCMVTGCPQGEVCEPGCCPRCVPTPPAPPPCDASNPCPQNQDCKDRVCTIRACKTDDECDCGVCVKGTCSRTFGRCVALPA